MISRQSVMSGVAGLIRPAIKFPLNAISRAFSWRNLFAGNTPGFRVNIEEAIRLNQQAMGSELVSNGSFDADTAWTKGAGWVIASGVATKTAGVQSFLDTLSPSSFVAGGAYRLSISCTRSAGNLYVYIRGALALQFTSGANPSGGTITVCVLAGSSSVTGLRIEGDASFVGSVDNVSVREIDLSKCVAFQDSAGTLPVVSMEQPLGLILDTKLGVPVRGAELVSNGDFSGGATGWTLGTGWTISSGSASHASAAGAGEIKTSASILTADRWYVAEFDRLDSGVAAVNAVFGTSFVAVGAGSGRKRVIGKASGTTTFGLQGGGEYQVDNISVRELPGNHFVQPSNTASRPIVSRRVNLLTATEDLGDAAWIASNGTVAANTVAAPTGAMTADVFTENTSTAVHNVYAGATNRPSIPAGSPIEVSFYIGRGTRRYVSLYAGSGGNGLNAVVDTTDFTITTARAIGAGYTLTASSVTPVGPDWCRVSFSGVCTSAITYIVSVSSTNSATPAIAETSFTGEAQTIRVWGADLRLSVDSNLPYQRVTSSTDYDEVGFPAYARFDGLDDWLETGGTVDMTSTDEVTVLAGVTKLSDAAAGVLVESSTTSSTTPGTVALFAPNSPAQPTYMYRSRGSSVVDALRSGWSAPSKALLSGVSKISTDTAVLRINGAQAATSANDQGTGNYGNYKAYIGRRAGSSLPFNGRIYGVTVIGRLLDDSTLARAEQAERQMGRLY